MGRPLNKKYFGLAGDIGHIVAVDISTSNPVDIIKQESEDSYWVSTPSGNQLLRLANPTYSASGLWIKATDVQGAQYAVLSLEAHLALIESTLLVQGVYPSTGHHIAQWSFANPAGGVVQIDNAA